MYYDFKIAIFLYITEIIVWLFVLLCEGIFFYFIIKEVKNFFKNKFIKRRKNNDKDQ